MASSERIFTLLDEKPAIVDNVNSIPIEQIRGNIEFKNVWFAYNSEDYVLKDISFNIREGEKVAFVGATGSDGVNIKDISQKDLRKNISVVLQDVFLFSGNIEKNITLGNTDITNEAINNAIDKTGLRYFINSLPDGIYHKVNERGSTFSTGQRQLISFARALAYDPKILILDEATSNIDTTTEILIQEATKKLIEGRTSIVIAHRLSTIQNCDKIIVMHKGEIKEMGSHQELLDKKGLYYKLYQLQYKEDITA
ncbi:unnamed protein product [Rotaria sp. Silwood1]|nr:unnamed protein product [Rotaria sp. Silwood1]